VDLENENIIDKAPSQTSGDPNGGTGDDDDLEDEI
jgi:hypothetical protein